MNVNNIPDAPCAEAGGRGRFNSGCGCSGLLGAFLICGGLLVLAIAFLTLSASIDRFTNFLADEDSEPASSSGSSLKNKVVQVEINGAIAFDSDSRSFWSMKEGSADDIIEDIKQAAEEDDVRGLLLVVNSPGGEITACDLIDREVKKFRDSSSNRYVVAYLRGMAASGGYYVSAHANRIVITPTTVTGSIGVLINGYNYAEAAEKLGIKSMTFTSGPMKDMLNPMKGVSEAVSNVVQGTISELHDRFVSVIAEGRNMPEEKVRELADGRIYTAKQAAANGLADRIGYMEQVREAFSELGLSDYEILEYRDEDDMMGKLRKVFSSLGGLQPIVKLPENSWRLLYASPFYNER